MNDAIKNVLGALAAAGVMFGAVFGTFEITGWPPFETAAAAERTKEQVEQSFKDSADTIKQVGQQLSSLNRWRDRVECRELSEQVARAREALARDRNNKIAQDSLAGALRTMTEIPSGCTTEASR